MPHTTVRDVVIWTKHVHGGDMAHQLGSLPGDTEFDMIVDGVRGRWCKMRDGKDGRPTPGVRPVGRAQAFWQSLFESRRGDSVTIEMGDTDIIQRSSPGQERASSAPAAGKIGRSAAQRQAAIAAVLAAPNLGWSSDGRTVTRDELYER